MTNYQHFPDTARVWIYQSDKPWTDANAAAIERSTQAFAQQWVSHNNQLSAFGKVFHNQFVVLMVDERQAGASGCSIDKSVHFMQALEQEYGISLFDRMTFTYKEGDKVATATRAEFAALYKAGKINDETLVFDNLVNTKADFEGAWLKPLGQSWHKRMV